MLAIDDVLCELSREDTNDQGLPPGFRFHPTDEELITFYLASKVFHGTFSAGGVDIAEVDLNRCEPWELPEVAKMGEREWYFFSLRDRKYPTGLRTNRATGAGYWKATGKDKEVYSSNNGSHHLLGLKKTLVFYKGRAPRGEKTKWVMHEYRLHGDFSYRHTCKEEWVICRIFHKAGDKKHHLPLQHSYLMEPSSSATTTASLPPLLETTTQLSTLCQPHNPFEIHQENDLVKTLINNNNSNNQLFSLVNGFQQKQEPSFSPSNTNPSQSMLFKSLLSHQDSISNNVTGMPKQCKTEANFSNYIHLPDAATMQHWLDKIYPDPYQNQPFLFHNTDGSSLCTTPPPTAHSFGFSADQTVHHDMSTSTAGFHMMLDF